MYNNNFYTVVLLLGFLAAFGQQGTYVVKDSISREPLPYANIDFLNGYGIFSDENGKLITNKDLPEKIKISYVGYHPKVVFLKEVRGTDIFLKSSTKVLEEMKIVAAKEDLKKREEFVTKPFLHGNMDQMYWSSIGQQIAFYIPHEKRKSELKSVVIPLIVKDIHQGLTEVSFEDEPYGTMVKFEFVSNDNGLPGEKLFDYTKVFVIYSAELTNKVEVKFEEKLPIPEKGFFLQMTVVGKTDTQGKYISELPYSVADYRNQGKKIMKIILPNYPLVESPNGTPTFFRNLFAVSQKWRQIEKPMVFKKDKEYPLYNIGIGYTISGYD
ncbi:carboxypeptidase-like regulatory domain-containing protein [Flavobacterium sp. SM15]|uniref:carboxypeptidase-like regulatory domain-containing protein n=1 Tax=Flavobacterium sp. SM15 TaxID=2908005 RepID=UPI001EDC005C|nr:carboxypeptidase-like regulatory domain-containing protein [Flavobacterium sp. SM15]MCG2610753.1 carboxypeptidase-like regulatory domain-containing protein [Flavobacterium sp. SM15]